MIRLISAARLKPSWVPTSTSLRSTLRTPATMFMYTGKKEPMAIRVTFDTSSIPSQISSRGTQARPGTARRAWKVGLELPAHAYQGADQHRQTGTDAETQQYPLGAGRYMGPQRPARQLAEGHQQVAGRRHQPGRNPAPTDTQLQEGDDGQRQQQADRSEAQQTHRRPPGDRGLLQRLGLGLTAHGAAS